MPIKIRVDSDANYKGIFFNGKTIRQKLFPEDPFGIPKYPEIEDVAINSKCYANCSYCYTSALKSGSNFTNIVDKAQEVWGSLKPKDRPFQIAIGGAGESTIHPDWQEFVKRVHMLGIIPNYTTNGMHLTDKLLEVTSMFCGGVALSYHPHLIGVFDKAMHKFAYMDKKVKLNTHIILSDDQSLNDLQQIFYEYKESFDYIVILPYQAAGRGISIDTHSTWIKTFEWIKTLSNKEQSRLAFGALFYKWIKANNIDLEMDLYEPELFSGYRMMDDSYKDLRKSSYDLTLK